MIGVLQARSLWSRWQPVENIGILCCILPDAPASRPTDKGEQCGRHSRRRSERFSSSWWRTSLVVCELPRRTMGLPSIVCLQGWEKKYEVCSQLLQLQEHLHTLQLESLSARKREEAKTAQRHHLDIYFPPSTFERMLMVAIENESSMRVFCPHRLLLL